MTSNQRKPQPPRPTGARPPAPARRHLRRSEIERRRQRTVIIGTAVVVALALIALAAGLIYDRVWLPGRPVAQVGDVTLTRGEYEAERRGEAARSIAQSLYLATFGPQFAQQFLDQIPQIDAQAAAARDEPVDDALVQQWIDLQLIRQGAQTRFGIQVTDGEVAQEFINLYGPNFAPPADAVTPTAVLPPTLPPVSTQEPTVGPGTPSPTPAGPTATPTPSPTPEPTQTPSPTPLPDEAFSRQQTALQRLYDEYVNEMRRIDPQRRIHLTIDDFRRGLYSQFLRQVLTRKVQERLVPDAAFTPTTDPSSIEVRHILLKVTVPVTATEEERERAFAARRAEAEALLAEARAAADFAELARERSEDFNTKETGGTLPLFDKDGKTTDGRQIDPAIVQAIANAAENEIVGPVRTSFGWHVVQLVRRTVDSREVQIDRARSEAFERWLEEQRTAISVQRFPTLVPTPSPLPTGTPAPLPTVELGGEPTPTPLPTPTATGVPAATPGTAPTPTGTAVPVQGTPAATPMP
ncbi:MAG: peptidylprolyl isomerase [Roseiflexaceae bacterium]|nr:peptidylprolyl isomerase [Roseiflexus sp.]MDW8213327.1 peptidylprolyl isomerase [Roseiflexaceae bacterium]